MTRQPYSPSGATSATTPPGGRSTTLSGDGNDLFITHESPATAQATGFAEDPALREAMGRAGVEGAPRIEIFADV